jgi:hypothetical protein
MRERTLLLLELIHNPLPDPDIIQKLAEFPRDCDRHLATISRADFLAILRQFEEGCLSASQLEEWATRLEGRNDIGFEFGEEGVVEEAIFWLSHIDIYGSIDSELCRHIEGMFERRCENRGRP